jgi:uncharacterized membrane protein HdeD (DUF308 family)
LDRVFLDANVLFSAAYRADAGLGRLWNLKDVALVALGTVALAVPLLATLTSVMLFGWLVVFGGDFEAVAAFSAPKWTGVLVHLLSGILGVVVGVVVVGCALVTFFEYLPSSQFKRI